MKLWLLEAMDTWFFRDGTPFYMGEASGGEVISRFPPSANSIQGLVRQVLAEGRGWSPGRADLWPKELGTSDSLGDLILRGPYLNLGGDWWFHTPLCVVKDKKGNMLRLKPGDRLVITESGKVRLPVVHGLGGEGISAVGEMINRLGLSRVLAGETPSSQELKDPSGLWSEEFRVGIAVDDGPGTVRDEMFYMARHIRPVNGLKVGFLVGGVPDQWHPCGEMVMPFGGEGRMARVGFKDSEPILPGLPDFERKGDKILFTVTLVTPGRYDADTNAVLRIGPFYNQGLHCISACIGKLQQTGGWDLANRKPRPLVPIVPAGSTWFYAAGESEFEKVKTYHGRCTGTFGNYGYGQIVLGTWKEEL
ncbi:MAG: type III-B CRISPR module-associated protein Cmr3 [Peptococcaceae bacterium]|nr:type III-B CRISPR module-associated protein Cmr3 [Peptococcaceae bacterium]